MAKYRKIFILHVSDPASSPLPTAAMVSKKQSVESLSSNCIFRFFKTPQPLNLMPPKANAFAAQG